jgi:hypothetical protein
MYVIYIQKPLSFFIDRPPGRELQKAFRSHIWFPAMGTKAGGVF